jgi:hypothetical protein
MKEGFSGGASLCEGFHEGDLGGRSEERRVGKECQ